MSSWLPLSHHHLESLVIHLPGFLPVSPSVFCASPYDHLERRKGLYERLHVSGFGAPVEDGSGSGRVDLLVHTVAKAFDSRSVVVVRNVGDDLEVVIHMLDIGREVFRRGHRRRRSTLRATS